MIGSVGVASRHESFAVACATFGAVLGVMLAVAFAYPVETDSPLYPVMKSVEVEVRRVSEPVKVEVRRVSDAGKAKYVLQRRELIRLYYTHMLLLPYDELWTRVSRSPGENPHSLAARALGSAAILHPQYGEALASYMSGMKALATSDCASANRYFVGATYYSFRFLTDFAIIMDAHCKRKIGDLAGARLAYLEIMSSDEIVPRLEAAANLNAMEGSTRK